mmetsp:Transcript_6352/g.8602  ORF Transcript_6352/g.8602 Transcript_6352/m.8602 type:complete len:397 (-) Transcript_6352:89-1279(-)
MSVNNEQQIEDLVRKVLLERSQGKDEVVDMRSDTVTTPTPAMRVAMALADVGDDVFECDETVNMFEREAAEALCKEAALFVPSGTMGNLISVMVHCEIRGSEAIVGNTSHMHLYEQGGMAQLAGIHPRVLPNNPDGTIDLELIKASIRPDDVHFPVTRLLVLENTHNKSGGKALSLDYMDSAALLCEENNMKLHVDGARLFNAGASLGVPPSRLIRGANSCSLCLSKALGAPAGGVLVGSKDFIHKARRARKVLGGGMRQVGVLAAAARVALRDMPAVLEQDHANAQLLAEGLNKIDEFCVNPKDIDSNLVYIGTTTFCAATLAAAVVKQNVLVLAVGPNSIRAGVHHQITKEGIQKAIAAFANAIAEVKKQKISVIDNNNIEDSGIASKKNSRVQ